MDREAVARLRHIGARTWLRTLDDRIGISHEELQRKQRTPAVPLPAVEPLLADKPEHLFPRPDRDRLDPDNPWGFRIDTPEHLYNRGELYNLAVERGTLSAEERHKINDHMVQTIRMLAQLPFPRHLRNVPEIAGGHHEKMDGSGYPRRLVREQLSLSARMMGVADVFEALTAADRPYKRGKTLSESLQIMARMSQGAHIDADVFALFLRSGAYLEYAHRFLRPEQIDAVDITRYLPRAEAAPQAAPA
jgi:HD domain